MRIVELTAPRDAGRYRAFFGQGLRDHTASFRISPADDAGEGFPTGAADCFTLAAEDETTGDLLGVASFRRAEANRELLHHRGLLCRMYVARAAQGRGVGLRLVQTLIERVRTLGDVRQINLTVAAHNEPARRLYQKLGFVSYSLEKNAVRYGDAFLDEESMALQLFNAPG